MKFSAANTDLLKALGKVINVVPSKSTLPILECILFELNGNELRLTASDLDIYTTVTLPVNGESDGKLAVPARKFHEALRALSNVDLHCTTDETSYRMTLKTEQGEYKMSGESAANFPEIESVASQFTVELESSLLRDIITKTVFAVSGDELRPAMMGILFQWREGEFRAVATDGHRLVRIQHAGAIAQAVAEGTMDVILPAKTMHLLLKTLSDGMVSVTFGNSNVKFQYNEILTVSRIIDERYPNYESVIPSGNDKSLMVNCAALTSVVHRCAIFSNAVTNQIRLSVSKNEVKVSAEDIDVGGEARETLPCVFDSDEEMEIGFNARYLAEALSHVDSENVEFFFSTPTRAGLLKPGVQPQDMDVLMLVMPLRLNA
jgi:DNA polymerase III subunit beta